MKNLDKKMNSRIIKNADGSTSKMQTRELYCQRWILNKVILLIRCHRQTSLVT